MVVKVTVMPRYFFTMNTDQEDLDVDGTALVGRGAARDEALALAGEILKESDKAFWNGPEWRLSVTDEAGATICEIRMQGVSEDA